MRQSGKGHKRAVAIPRRYPRREPANHEGPVNHRVEYVNIAPTSSKSCSAGGVLGRDGATDSGARRPIAKSEGVRKRECGVFRQGESDMARLEKEFGIPGSQASVTLRIGDTGDNLSKIPFLAAHFQRPRRGGTGLHSSRRQDVHAPDAVSAKFLYTKNERNPSSSGFVTAIISISPDCITRMSTSLDHLKATGTVVVSDSGDFECKILSYITNG